jgi:hypothetical protein
VSGRDSPESFESFVAERDVACPICGYNLRGMRGPVCPECGAGVDFGVFRKFGPRAKTYRWAQAGAFLCGMAGLTGLIRTSVLAHRHAGPWEIGAVVAVSAVSCGVGAGWLIARTRAVWWPGHVQGRVASAIWLWLALMLIVSMGAGAM